MPRIKWGGYHHFWSSYQSGSYVTYIAVNGTGYVRTLDNESSEVLLSAVKTYSPKRNRKNIYILSILFFKWGQSLIMADEHITSRLN